MASLLPSVQKTIVKGRLLIAGMKRVTMTAPAGGHGLSKAPVVKP